MKMKKLRNASVASVAVFALALSACSSDDSSSSAPEGTAGGAEIKADGDYNQLERDQIKDGGELTLAISEISLQQNPFHADGTLYTNNVWDWYNPQIGLFEGDGTFYANPAYISNVSDEIVDGKTVVTYDIVEEAQYNDGTPIDWTVFEHTWKYNNGEMEGVVPSSTDGYEQIESVERGESDKQVVITFKQAYPWWEGLFNYLLPPQVDSAEKFNEAYVNKVHPEWGAGPYKIDDIDFQGGTVTFVKNENWWGEEGKLDKFTYRQMESQASLNAFKAGEIDATGASSNERYTVAKDMGDAAEIRTSLTPSNYLVTLNSDAPALEDIAVREAIFTAIDRSQLAAIAFNGLDYTEELPGSFTLFQTQEGYEDNFGSVVSYDQEKAKSLLDEAGWAEGAEGVREKDGEQLTLRYVITGDSDTTKTTAAAIQKMLSDVGVKVEIVERPSSDFSKVVTEKDFDIFLMGFSSSDPFGVAYFGQIYNSDSELNKSGTGTPELDEKIRELQAIPEADEQIARANELEKEAFATFGIMPYANGPDIVAVKPGLANFGAYSFASVPVENIGWEAE